MATGLITFLSDFGTEDSYVAQVKGTILFLDPDLQVVDVTHQVPPQDIQFAAFQLCRVAASFPPGTVHLAVVDPGVGTERRPVVVEAGSHVLVGPDNGLFSWVVREWKGSVSWRTIDRQDLYRSPLSETFHGRDLFAPIAAALASGRLLASDCGPLVKDPVVLPWPEPEIVSGSASGEVLVVDRFGNLIVGIPVSELACSPLQGSQVFIVCDGRTLEGIWSVYGSGTGPVVHEDSSGFIEVALTGGNASEVLNIRAGDRMELRWD